MVTRLRAADLRPGLRDDRRTEYRDRGNQCHGAIGAGLAVRRASLAHIVYNVAVGIIGILLLGPLAAAGRWIGAQVDDPDGVLALAAFGSIFKLVGILAFYPWLDRFAYLIERITGSGVETAVTRLDPVLAEAGGDRRA